MCFASLRTPGNSNGIFTCGIGLIRLFDMAIDVRIGLGDCRFRFTELANSFNGEPQAQAKHGNDACGLPLND